MPIYTFELDGRRYRVEAESPEEAEAFLDTELGGTGGADEEAPAKGGMGRLGAILAAAGLVGAGVAARKPELLKRGASKAFDVVQSARHLGALSGTAVPKSIVGNVGAPFVAAAERRSTAPIREFFSRQTAKDWLSELRNPEVGREIAEKGMERRIRFNPFGRVMSAGDVATRGALKRSGMTESEAARAVLQTPLQELGISGKALEALESKAGQLAVLYRRTPLNIAIHGAKALTERPSLAALAAAAGGIQAGSGGITGDPLSIAMLAPAAGVYSLPYLAGAGATKLLLGQKGEASSTMRGLSPIPEFGPEVLNPLRPVAKPAAFSALDRISRLLRTGRSY